MTATRWLLFPLAMAVGCLAQTKSGTARDGKYWVETSYGTESLAGATRLTVVTRGTVSLRGEARPDIGYILVKRARAAGPTELRAAMTGIVIKRTVHRKSARIEVVLPRGAAASADLQLRVPRTLHAAVVESQGESIEVLDLDGALQADSSGGRIYVDRVQGDVTVRTGGGPVRLGQLGRNVLCFSGGGEIVAGTIGGESTLNTEGGEIVVKQARGLMRASTRGGNIRVDRAERGLTATAYAGLIDVHSASGPVVAETGAGAIRVRSAGDVQCKAGAGAIHLNSVYGGLRAATRSGSIIADLARMPLENSWLSTDAGDITVFIPSNLAVTVQAISALPGSHRIVSDFAEVRASTPRNSTQAEAQGAINGGGPLLRLTASGGTIYLRRMK